jgi:hypothetical protein
MDKNKMRAFLNATNGGLDIFRNYINTPFRVDKAEVVKSVNKQFIITYNERYKNYVITIKDWNGLKWTNPQNFNGVWYLKETFKLTEQEVYDLLEYEMGIKISEISNVSDTEDSNSDFQIKASIIKVSDNFKSPEKKQSLLEELMSCKTDNYTNEVSIENIEMEKNEVKVLTEKELKDKRFRESLR